MVIKEFLKLVAKNQENFSRKEQQLVVYIMDNISLVVEMTMDELLFKSNCGYSTIYSFFRKLGFTGYRDFIISLYKELNYDNFNNSLFINNNIKNDKQSHMVLKEYLVLLNRTNNWLENNVLKQAADLIKNCSHIYVFGSNEFYISAFYAVNRFIALGKKAVQLSQYTNNLFIQLKFAQENDVLIIVNNLHEQLLLVECCKFAKALKMKIIFIGINFDKQLLNKADAIFYLSTKFATEFDWKKPANFVDSFFTIDNLIQLIDSEK